MVHFDDPIVAIATPLGEGGLGVIRLSGSGVFDIADRIFHAKIKLSNALPHTLHHGWIANIDEVVAAVFRGPHSFTGEDVIEFSCHGSPVILKEVVRLCLTEGARLAKPGEFTERAYLNGKMDLMQAEAVADLIHSQSSRARMAATEQLRGQLSLRIKGLRDQLIDLLAHIEANLDFSEEEIPIIAQEKISNTLARTQNEIDELLSTSVKGRLLRDGLRVALAGKPNVGKSSLFNALLAEDRAIVASMPGTTRDTLEERMEWNGLSVVLIDTAGLRHTVDEVEAQGTARAASAHAQADVVVLVLDSSFPLTEEDFVLQSRFKDRKVVVVLNKIDKGQKVHMPGCYAVSAKESRGLAELKEAILKVAQRDLSEKESSVIVTNMRHVEHLEKSSERVAHALAAVQRKEAEESIALDIRAALEELGHITGESVTEEVLSAIFRQFCIGK